MIYLKRTTDLQAVYLHTTGLETAGTEAVLRLASTTSGQQVAEVPLEQSEGAEYVEVRFSLPDGIPQGEYRYEVVQDGKIVGSGLAVVGEPAPVAVPAAGGEGIGNIIIKQYGE